MLFNSNAFVFVFLPVVLAVFFGVRRALGTRAALGSLLAASVFFYGWWSPYYVLLLAGSIGFNFALARAAPGISGARHRRAALAMGITVNLAALGYCKYANFFVGTANEVFGTSFHLEAIVLPLAISFFTFQQIAYAFDAYRGECEEYNLLAYSLFVTFFPQLIAGPIVHHQEMLPQFKRADRHFRWEGLAVGATFFVFGLFSFPFLPCLPCASCSCCSSSAASAAFFFA